MNLRNKIYISMTKRLIFVCLTIVIVGVIGGCNQNTQPSDSSELKSEFLLPQTSSASENLDLNPSMEPAETTKFGVIATGMPNFDTPPVSETIPVVFENNGKYGYKDSKGNVLLPAEYSVADKFHNGMGQVRQDIIENNEKQIKWLEISPSGEIFDFDWVGTFYENLWLAVAVKDGKYGIINTDFDEILPLEYDHITLSSSEENFICYAIKDGNVIQLDLLNKIIYSYEPYDHQKSTYVDTIDISHYNIAIMDSTVTVNGKTDTFGDSFPFAILNMIEFDIYQENQKVITEKGKIIDGPYENTLIMSFDSIETYSQEFFAVPSGKSVYPRPVTLQTDGKLYDKVVKQFLLDNHIEGTPYTIGKVLTGDLFDTGTTSALIQISSTNEFKEERWSDSWSEEQYKNKKAAIFSAILLLPDVDKPLEYKIVSKEIRQDQHADMYGGMFLRTAAQLYGDSSYEVLLENAYYESINYSVISLES